mmetsp:Transcript_35023/g.102661  ORF Transcript_35023/g.102661 Transcript_35023/m.102661 type:complete len:277 (-) Transcript_35023:1320-2150(-)
MSCCLCTCRVASCPAKSGERESDAADADRRRHSGGCSAVADFCASALDSPRERMRAWFSAVLTCNCSSRMAWWSFARLEALTLSFGWPLLGRSFLRRDSDTAVLSSGATALAVGEPRGDASGTAGARSKLAGCASSQDPWSASLHGSACPKRPICSPDRLHKRTVQSVDAEISPSTPLRYSTRTTARRWARHAKRILMCAREMGCDRTDCSTKSEMSQTLMQPAESPVKTNVLVSSAQTWCKDSAASDASGMSSIKRPERTSQKRSAPSADPETST